MSSDGFSNFLLSTGGSLLAGLLLGALSSTIYFVKRRKVVPHVMIEARKIVGAAASGFKPDVLIAILTPIPQPHLPATASDEERRRHAEDSERLLSEGDHDGLRLSERTRGPGHTLRAIAAYPSLARVYLIPTKQSVSSVRAIRRYVSETLRRSCTVIADTEHALTLVDDAQITNDAYDQTKAILEGLKREGLDNPRSKILVDVSGGTRSMLVGSLLACLGWEQDVHLIGAPYDRSGRPNVDAAFPVLIHFEPRLPRREP